MRRFALLAGLCLVAAACGGEGTPLGATSSATTAATTGTTAPGVTSTSLASTTAPTTTTSTLPATTTTLRTFPVPAVDLCVIDHLSDDALNLRSGPGTDFPVIGTLPYDATGVHATGVAAADAAGRTWKEIDYGGDRGWVAGWLLTENECTLAVPGDYCIAEPRCGLSRLPVRGGPGTGYAEVGALPWHVVPVEATGASTTGAEGVWQQIRLRGEVGWVPAASLRALPCPPVMCPSPLIPPSPTCIDGRQDLGYGSLQLEQALELIGVGGTGGEVEPDAFVVEEARLFSGPEDANLVAPRPTVERIYLVGYAQTDPGFRGRWLLRRAGFGLGLAAVAPYASSGFGPGVWETCVDTCQVGRPLAGEWCNPECVEDYLFRPCEGIAPGTWAPGDCAGPPPEVLGCLAP